MINYKETLQQNTLTDYQSKYIYTKSVEYYKALLNYNIKNTKGRHESN